MSRRDDTTPQPDPLAAFRTMLERQELYSVLQGLLAALDADDEHAYAILCQRHEFTTPSGRDINEMWQDDWEGVAGSTLSPRFRNAVADYEHRRDLRRYGAMFEPHYLAYTTGASATTRLAGLFELFELWHGELRQRSYVQQRTREELGRRYLNQLAVDRLVTEALTGFISDHAQRARKSKRAFDELYDLRLAFRGTSGKRRRRGPKYKITPELRNWFRWPDPDNWHALVDLYIDSPTPADFGDSPGPKIPVQKFVKMANAALTKTGSRCMAKRVYALVVYAGYNNLSAVTVEKLRRKASRRNP